MTVSTMIVVIGFACAPGVGCWAAGAAPAPPTPAAGATGAAGAATGATAGAMGAAAGALAGATGATGAAAGALAGATGATATCRRSRCLRKGVGAGDGEGIVDVWREGAGSMRRMASRSRGMPFGTGKRGLSAKTRVVRINERRKAGMSIGRMMGPGYVGRLRSCEGRGARSSSNEFGRER